MKSAQQTNVVSLFTKLISLRSTSKCNDNTTDVPDSCQTRPLKESGEEFSKTTDSSKSVCKPQDTAQLSLIDKIASQCQQANGLDRQGQEKSANSHNQLPQSPQRWKELLSESLIEDVITQMVNLITSTNKSVSLDEKLSTLTCLQDECAKNHDLCELLGSSRLVYYTEELLVTFCDAVTKHNSGHTPIVPAPSLEELCLLRPILALLIPAVNMRVEMIRSTFLLRSDILSQLMRASSLCAYSVIHTLKRVEKLAQGKLLACASYEMTTSQTYEIFEKCFAINISNMRVNVVGSRITVFDTSDHTVDLNINEEIMKNQPPRGIPNSSNLDSDDKDITNVDNAKWSDVVIIRTFPPRFTLVYMQAQWRETLVDTSGQMYNIRRSAVKSEEAPRLGDVVGFSSNDAKFEGSALLLVPYLRGQVLSISEDQTMLWAMDIGLFTHISKENLFSLQGTSVISQPPLVNICVLQGRICDLDENFLKQLLNLLKVILETNAQAGKYMLLCDTGQYMLIFLEYPNINIRITVLDILLNLTQNCKEVQKFMEKYKFDIKLAERLLRYAHGNQSALFSHRLAFRTEIFIMAKILLVILENKANTKEWPGNEPATLAFKILREDVPYKWKRLFDSCLFLLEGKPICKDSNQQTNTFRYNRTGWRPGYNRRGSHCPRLPRNNTLSSSTSVDKEDPTNGHHEHQQVQETSSDDKIDAVKPEEATLITTQTDYLIFGSQVDVGCDQTHHLMPQKILYNLKELELAQVLCGLLNNNIESSMYFGITNSSLVDGIMLSREDKDVFRNGVDRIMSKCLLPEVRANCYEITFTPVVRHKDTIIDIHKNNLYVVEIRVAPLMHMAYVLYQGRKCYMRQNTETVEWTVMQKKNYMMEMEENELDDAIESFKNGYDGNLASLADFVEKYLPCKTEKELEYKK